MSHGEVGGRLSVHRDNLTPGSSGSGRSGRSRSRVNQRALIPYWFVLPAIAVILLTYVFPVIYNIALSFQRKTLIEPKGDFVGLAQYREVLTTPDFWESIRLLLIWLGGTLPAIAVLGMGLALLLNRKIPGIALFRGLLFVPWIVPDYIASILFVWILDPLFGVLNYALAEIGLNVQDTAWFSSPESAMAAVVILGIWKAHPFVTLMCLAGLQSVPKDVHEAATVDGASPFQRFRDVTIPFMTPVFVASMLLMTIWMAHTVTLIYVATRGGPLSATTTTPILTYNTAFIDQDFGRSATISVIFVSVLSVGALGVIKRMYREQK
jgi:multiple sugar transport system permease protein